MLTARVFPPNLKPLTSATSLPEKREVKPKAIQMIMILINIIELPLLAKMILKNPFRTGLSSLISLTLSGAMLSRRSLE
jgi:hypothetical protein